jgi:hypothetical protein
MKKILFLFFALLMFSAVPVSASLWNFYQEQGLPLPSLTARKTIASSFSMYNYIGSYKQNVLLEQALRASLNPSYDTLGTTYGPTPQPLLNGNNTWTANNNFVRATSTRLIVGNNGYPFQGASTTDGLFLLGNSYGIETDYGNGSDGNTTTPLFYTDKVWNFTSLTITAGTTSTVATTTVGMNDSIVRVKVQGDCTIAGGIDLSGFGALGGAGGTNQAGTNGATSTYALWTVAKSISGRRGESGGVSTLGGEGAGGYYGTTVDKTKTYNVPTSTVFVLRNNYIVAIPGSGGGGGNSQGGTYTGGNGGNGGGAMVLTCGGNLTFTGNVNVAGYNGKIPTGTVTGGTCGGGGGGAGGYFYGIGKNTVTDTGSKILTGGSGGSGAGCTGLNQDGGPGANGIIIIGKK